MDKRNESNNLSRTLSISWTIAIGVISGLLGILADPIIGSWTQPFFSYDNLPVIVYILVLFVFVVLATFAALLLQHNETVADNLLQGNKTVIDSVDANLSLYREELAKISRFAGPRSTIVSYEDSLSILLEYAKDTKEILQYTRYIFDWSAKKSLYPTSHLNNSQRQLNYDRALEGIKERIDKDYGRYIRIFSIPKGEDIKELFTFDPYLKGQVELLSRISLTQPERGSIRISDDSDFHNSFIIVDGSFLLLDFDLHDVDSGIHQKTFSLIVQDPESTFIRHYQRLHNRLEASSRLYIYPQETENDEANEAL